MIDGPAILDMDFEDLKQITQFVQMHSTDQYAG
jgi:hypothetical protein